MELSVTLTGQKDENSSLKQVYDSTDIEKLFGMRFEEINRSELRTLLNILKKTVTLIVPTIPDEELSYSDSDNVL